jgi:hypothetical protein
MKTTIAIFYTGDIRHNQEIAKQNHQRLIDRIGELASVHVYYFTRNDPQRGACPYDPPEGDPHDNVYRRGQGGAVQVWDFMRGVQRTTEDIVMKLRTDLWFTDTSIDAICFDLQEMIAGRSGIAYFGSDWVNKTAGAVNDRLPVHIDFHNLIQDFVVLARRDSLKSFQDVIDSLNTLNPNKRRSGNKTFRFIIPTVHEPWRPDAEMLSSNGLRKQLTTVHRVLCQIWLIRQDYAEYPSDNIVCRDYIQSYIADDKAKMGKKNMIIPHPMTDAVNWWRAQQGWAPTEIEVGEWWAWQSE